MQTIHHYSSTRTNSERLAIFSTLAFLSAMVTIGLSFLMPGLFTSALWQASIIGIVIYLIMIILFNRYFWKWRLWRLLRLVNTPSLQGIWKGKLTASWAGTDQVFEIQLVIRQTWLWIQVDLITQEALSKSITASVLRRDTGEVSVCYVYEAVPKADVQPALIERHNGMCILTLHNHNTLSGFYEYYDRVRQVGVLGQIFVER